MSCFALPVLLLLLPTTVNVFPVIGALIGKQEGRNIEVMNSFELLSHTVDDRAHIDKEYYYTKEEQCELYCHCVNLSGLCLGVKLITAGQKTT